MSNKSIKIERQLAKSFLALINNSVGAKTFQNFYALTNGRSSDLMLGGELSCAFFVSSVCTIFGLIKRMHGTVTTTITDLENSGWTKVARPKIGDILVWEEARGHRHIGFYVAKDEAISNSAKKKIIARHHWTFGEKNKQALRNIELILRYDFKKHEH